MTVTLKKELNPPMPMGMDYRADVAAFIEDAMGICPAGHLQPYNIPQYQTPLTRLSR
jgi:hypothetical protein